MPLLTSLWTTEQLILSVVIIGCCLMLRSARAAEGDFPRPGARWSRGVLIVAAAFAALFLLVRSNDPIGIRPDSWMDACVVVAGRNYVRDGLFARSGAPQHQVMTDTHPSDSYFIYTRHPIGANLVNGALQCSGLSSDRLMRVPPLLCSLLGVWLWLLVFRRYVDEPTASLSAAILATSYGFLAYADLLYFHAYALAAVAGAVYCFVRGAAGSGRPAHGWLIASCACMFAGALFTWEYHLWLIVFLLACTLLLPMRIRPRGVALLVLTMFLAAGLHAAWRLHVIDDIGLTESAASGVKRSIFYNIYLRTIGFAESVDTPDGVNLGGYPLHLAIRFYCFYGIPVMGLAAFPWLVLARPAQARGGSAGTADDPAAGVSSPRAGQRLLIALLLAGVAWWCVMMQHSSVHMQVMRHFLPAYALLMGMSLAACVSRFRDLSESWPVRASAMLLAAAIGYIQVEGLVCNLRMHFDNSFVDARGRDDVGREEGREFARLQHVVPPDAVILTNSNRHAPMRLWSRRPVYETVYRTARTATPKRAGFELAFNHLRDLHRDRLPRLCYVFCTRDGDWEQAVRQSTYLRFLLLGNGNMPPDDAWRAAAPILAEAAQRGRSDRSSCPITGLSGRFACFDLAPAIPLLTRQFASMGYPTLQEFEQTE